MDYSKYIEEYLIRPDSKFQGEGKYFHYTSLESCINMLKHTDGEFEIWASHLSFLNDKEELINGMKLIDRKVEDLLLSKGDTLSDWIEEYQEGRMNEDNLLDDIYVVCFCSKRSLLSQWKYYGKNSGIAIEYNLDFCEYSGYIASNIPFKNMNQEYLPNYVNKVIYVGNLIKRKYPLEVLKSFHTLGDRNFHLSYIGLGREEIFIKKCRMLF